MAKLDALVNQSYSVDSQYFGVSLVSGSAVVPSIANSFTTSLNSLTAQALNVVGPGGVRGEGEQLTILAVDDTANTISYEFTIPSVNFSSSLLTSNVLGYDQSSGSILFDTAISSHDVAVEVNANTESQLNPVTGILSSTPISGQTITYPALTSSTIVGAAATPTPTPTGSGSSAGNAALPIYRFFDTVLGTHLFTQSLTEAQQIISARPDLTQETNNFGAVSSSSPSAEQVYRFFENGNGTHFFTASRAEFLGLTTPGSTSYRGDFTYEASSSFYVDSTQQSGDVAVYRLFDATHGTQFLTGSQSEFQGLTTPGSATYRSDLTAEGIAFYAPAGTSHT